MLTVEGRLETDREWGRMSNISMRKFNVLVVDQDDSHRWLMHNVLEKLGVGEIITANSGTEAYQLLKRMHGQPARKRLNAIDIVFCDMAIGGMDGLSLLRWIRMDKASPNSFLPFVLMAPHLDGVDLKEARGFGVNQFVLKPATAEAIADKIMLLVNRPRQYIYSPTYFGPDRRTANVPPQGKDRRINREGDLRVIRGEIEELMENRIMDGMVRYLRPVNHLKRKGGGAPDGDDLLFTVAAVENADRAMQQAKESYIDNALQYVDSLSIIWKEASSVSDRKQHFRRINSLARQLGIQGETFGYPLVTVIGNSLNRFTAAEAHKDDASLELVKAHIDSVSVILKNRIAGDGGEIGRELVSQLQAAIKKITSRNRTPV